MDAMNHPPLKEKRALSGDELADLHDQFGECDADGDGCIDLAEFSRLLGCLVTNPAPQQGRAQFDEIDVDRDGVITQDEFMQWWRGR